MNKEESEQFYQKSRFILGQAFNRENALYGQWARARRINRNHLSFFWYMESMDHCTVQELHDIWLISKQTLSSILAKLEEQNYIQLLPKPQDKRSKIIRLTDLGKAYSQEILQPLYQLEEDALRKLGPKKTQEILALRAEYLQAFKESKHYDAHPSP